MDWFKTIKNRFVVFRNDEDGSHTVEAVIWLPIFVLILALLINVSVIYNRQSMIIRVVQDANRAYSVGRFTNTREVELFIEQAIDNMTTNAVAATTLDSGVISTRVEIPATDLMPVDVFDAFRSATVTVSAQQYAEF